MKVLTVFLPVEEFAAVMESAAAAGQKPYAWARAALRTATRSPADRAAPVPARAIGRPTIEQIVTRTMPADEFFEVMERAGFSDDETEAARADALKRGTLREGKEPYPKEDGTPGQRYIIFPTTEGKP